MKKFLVYNGTELNAVLSNNTSEKNSRIIILDGKTGNTFITIRMNEISDFSVLENENYSAETLKKLQNDFLNFVTKYSENKIEVIKTLKSYLSFYTEEEIKNLISMNQIIK